MKKWREDAQPEWPEAASATQDLPLTGGNTQSFPETGRTGRRRDGRGGQARLAGTEPEPGTEILSSPGGAQAALLRDPWGESGAAAPEGENAHDPHEVTVQLDSVQFGESALRAAKGKAPGGRPGSGPGGGQDASDAPVFVDESGRRSRTFRRIGIAVGISCAAYAGVIVVTLLSGNSSAPWLPVPGQDDDKPAGQVDVSPTPRLSADPVGVGTGGVPVPALSVPGGTTATPGVPAPLPSQSAGSGKPSASADPGPSTGTSALPSPSGTSKDPVPESSAPVVQSPSPSASPTDGGGSAAPSVTPGGGTGPVADGPADPAPVQSSPAGSASSAAPAEPSAPSSSSTENVL